MNIIATHAVSVNFLVQPELSVKVQVIIIP